MGQEVQQGGCLLLSPFLAAGVPLPWSLCNSLGVFPVLADSLMARGGIPWRRATEATGGIGVHSAPPSLSPPAPVAATLPYSPGCHSDSAWGSAPARLLSGRATPSATAGSAAPFAPGSAACPAERPGASPKGVASVCGASHRGATRTTGGTPPLSESVAKNSPPDCSPRLASGRCPAARGCQEGGRRLGPTTKRRGVPHCGPLRRAGPEGRRGRGGRGRSFSRRWGRPLRVLLSLLQLTGEPWPFCPGGYSRGLCTPPRSYRKGGGRPVGPFVCAITTSVFCLFFHLHVTLVGCVQIPDNPNRFKSSTIKFIHGMRTNRPYLMIQLYINFHWKELPEAAPWGRESLVGKQEKQEQQEKHLCFHMEK